MHHRPLLRRFSHAVFGVLCMNKWEGFKIKEKTDKIILALINKEN